MSVVGWDSHSKTIRKVFLFGFLLFYIATFIIYKTGFIKYSKTAKNQNNIAKGIAHQTSIFAIGDKTEICPKLNITIGIVKEKADKVKTKLSFIANLEGKK